MSRRFPLIRWMVWGTLVLTSLPASESATPEETPPAPSADRPKTSPPMESPAIPSETPKTPAETPPEPAEAPAPSPSPDVKPPQEEAPPPTASVFRGEYLNPQYGWRYERFLAVDRADGLLHDAYGRRRPVFVLYSQAGGKGREGEEGTTETSGHPLTDHGSRITDHGSHLTNEAFSPLQFDYDQVERDLALLAQAGLDVYLRWPSWGDLLTEQGDWQELQEPVQGHNLPRFRWACEVYDYLLDRIQAHGRCAVVELPYDFFWAADAAALERPALHLLDERVWPMALATHQKIAAYFASRQVIAAWVIRQAGLRVALSPEDPRVAPPWQAFLRETYGSVERLQAAWGEVAHEFQNLAEVSVPQWEGPALRPPADAQGWVEAPAWVDFLTFHERVLIDRLNEWAGALREADPHHLLYYSQASDLDDPWPAPPVEDRSRLPFDLIGAEADDPGRDASALSWSAEASASARQQRLTHSRSGTGGYVQGMAYAPYLRATETLFSGVGSGLAGGGGARREVKRHCRQWLADAVGSGAAAILGPAWSHLTLPQAGMAYDYGTLGRVGDLAQGLYQAPFTRPRARLLILRNRAAARGPDAARDRAGVLALAERLYQLHLPFDLLTDADLTADPQEPFKVPLDSYDFIFVPNLQPLFAEETWQTLGHWLGDPTGQGRGWRGLWLGNVPVQFHDAHFQPLPAVPPTFQKLTGLTGGCVQEGAALSGNPVRWTLERDLAGLKAGHTLSFAPAPEFARVGRFPDALPEGVEPILTGTFESPDGTLLPRPILVRHRYELNAVYLAGFHAAAMDQAEEPPAASAAWTTFYRSLLAEVGVKATWEAPANLGIHVAQGYQNILVQERFGETCDELLCGPMGNAVYTDAVTIKRSDGNTVVQKHLGAYQTELLTRVAGADLKEGEAVQIRARRLRPMGYSFGLRGKGVVEMQIRSELPPDYQVPPGYQPVYEVAIGPDRQRLRPNEDGLVTFTVEVRAERGSVAVSVIGPLPPQPASVPLLPEMAARPSVRSITASTKSLLSASASSTSGSSSSKAIGPLKPDRCR